MSHHTLQKLEEGVSTQILASSSIPSFHNVVEELVLNAVDASSTRIEVYVNMNNLSITVADNGIGISKEDLIHYVGEWHHSSKKTHSSYGFKGQAIASIRQLAEKVEVTSCAKGCKESIIKSLSKAAQAVIHVQPECKRGTTVSVFHLFYEIPVRARAIKKEIEISLIKEFLQKMSVLHHQISWRFIDQHRKTVICDFPSVLSVSKQIINFHGLQVVSKFKNVQFQSSKFKVEGLLSTPIQSCCSWNKDCQYMYINNRWMRNKDLITNLLNKYFTKIFSISQYGPNPKHSSMEALHNQKYPMFVLNFTCPANECDILVEPDKTAIFFKHKSDVEEFLISFLIHISEGQFIDFYENLKKMIEPPQYDPSSTPNKKRSITPVNEKLYWSDLMGENDSSKLVQSQAEEDSVLSAFLSFSPPKENDDLNIPDKNSSRSIYSSEISSGVISKIPSFPEVFPEETSRADSLSFNEASSVMPSEGSSIVVHSLDPSAKINYTTEIMQRDYIEVIPKVNLSLPVISSKKELTLERSLLSTLKYLGRWDNKYILAIDEASNLILAFDQHAVDERIQYEELTKKTLTSERQTKKVNTSKKTSLLEFQLIQQYNELLRSWGFEILIKNDGKLILQQVPTVLGETLTIEDMLEFVQYAHNHREIPNSLLKPPAFNRILASKACHASVKFNDILTKAESVSLINNLQGTNMPFQCAHGRPSASPVVDLKDLFESKMQQKVKKIRLNL